MHIKKKILCKEEEWGRQKKKKKGRKGEKKV